MKISISILAVCLAQLTSAAPSFERRAVSGYNGVANSGWATVKTGTTGGSGGTVTTVTTVAALEAAIAGNAKKIVIISGTLTSTASEGLALKPGSNTSILGASGATLVNIGIRIINVSNVIVRGLKIQKVIAPTDAIAIQKSTFVWIDHNELSADQDHDKDFYDGLLDITHAGDFITVSYNYLHDHWKGSLVGHSDSNSAEDTGHLLVSYHHNYFSNLNSRGPSFRFGTGHIYNNYYNALNDGINTRDGAQLLVENNVFVDTGDAIYSTDAGFVVATGNDLGVGTNKALVGTIKPSDIPYSYTLDSIATVKSAVRAAAGATISFTSSQA
ncbi:hypothetical protein Q9L58_008261 [Maublancomyces gigas]|uniref:Pectate lyase domain-containing protein n=1 Tax=Discina gigas TaxID=1032678 RepID=A0ABR3GA48_9PEZI